ncbi:MAG: hypothetical protein ABI479_07400 [Gallionella sp.]
MPKSNIVKRRIIYVDGDVQKGLLVALVTLEVLLIAGTLWMLYLQMSEIVDANLYTVHISEKPNIYPLMLKTALVGVAGLIAINVMVLWVAAWVWARHVDSILKPFRELIGKVEALDFSEDDAMDAPHKVVELALAWRHAKRQDMLRLHHEIARLDELKDWTDAATCARARASLEAIREMLPNW